MAGSHGSQTIAKGIHTAFRWSWADATARGAETNTAAADITNYSIGLQQDNNSLWRLISTGPNVWEMVGILPFRWSWANASARTSETDVAQIDVDSYNVGIQLDDGTMWRASSIGPIVWAQVGGAAGGGGNTHTEEDAVTAAVTNVVTVQHNSTGTPADGFGTGIEIQAETDTTENMFLGSVEGEWWDATHALRRGMLKFYLQRQSNKVLSGVIVASSVAGATPTITWGSGAVDLQTLHSLTSHGVTGDWGAALGGRDNLVSADQAATIGGIGAIADRYGELAHASNLITTHGDVKYGLLHCARNIAIHTLNTWFDIYLDEPGTGNILINDDSASALRAIIIGVTSGATEMWAYELDGAVRKAGAAAPTVVSGTVNAISESDANYNVQFAEVSGDLALQVRRTGGTDYDVIWSALIYSPYALYP